MMKEQQCQYRKGNSLRMVSFQTKLRGGFLLCCCLLFFNTTKAQSQKENGKLNFIYRTVDWTDYNGSAYTVDGDAIRNIPVTNLENTLGGLVPGVFSNQSQGGMVNEGPGLWIRGRRTSNEGVLTLIDGQESSFGMLSPYEVEKITVLKDAAAIALYGMRGANGAILVTTRKGGGGKPKVEFSSQFTLQNPISKLEALGSSGYAQYYNEALMNDGLAPVYSQYDIAQYQSGLDPEKYPDINWFDKYYKDNTLLQRYNLNISGGGKNSRYFVNAGYLTQSGMFNTENETTYSTNNEIKRYNFRSNVEFNVTKTTFLSLGLYGWYENQNRPQTSSADVFNVLLTTPPNAFPAYFLDNGNYKDASGNQVIGLNKKIIAGNSDYSNGWAMLNRAGYTSDRSVYGSFRVSLAQDLSMVLKGLQAKATLSMDSRSDVTVDRSKSYAYYQLLSENTLQKTGTDGKMANANGGKNSPRMTTMDFQLVWARTFDKNALSASVFYDQYETTTDVSLPTRFQNLNGFLSYNFDKRYGMDFLMSYSGCSKFEKGNQFGFFPTLSAGWTISNESFFENMKDVMPYLKLKGSYGLVGSHRGVDAFYYKGRLASTSNAYYFGNTMTGAGGYLEDIIANPTLSWEKSKQWNLGLESKMFGNHLTLGGDYFVDNRTNIYTTNNRVSSLFGFDLTISQNIGKTNSKGFELYGNWNSSLGKDLHFTIGGTFSFSESEILDLGQADQPYPYMSNVGYPLGAKSGLIAEGLFKSYAEIAAAPQQTYSSVQPGDIRYKDLNNDGMIDANDVAYIGYSDVPQIFYGMNLGVSYKSFGVNALFQGVGRVSMNLDNFVTTPFYGKGNIYEHQLDYWSLENQENASSPRLSTVYSSSNNVRNSTYWMRDASYLRLKTLEVYYDFPKSMLKNVFMESARIFVSGYNLLTFDNIDMVDPEASTTSSNMPLTRNMSVGCSIKF